MSWKRNQASNWTPTQDLVDSTRPDNFREDQEEERIRRQLGDKLAEWLPQLRSNVNACALLDFRLAESHPGF
jgi:hypothetical protein